MLFPVPISEFLGLRKPKATPPASPAPGAASSSPTKNAGLVDDATEVDKPLPLRSLLTRDVVVAAGNYASLSLVDIAFRAIHPVFLSTPIALGGLGLAPPTIGNLLSIYGVLNGVIQVFCFAQLNDRFGSKRVFMCGIASAVPLFAAFPLVNWLARERGYSTLVWAVVVLQIANSVAVSMAYGARSSPVRLYVG